MTPLLLLAAAIVTSPDTISGPATAIDGDTIRLGSHMDVHVRILGIAAPETYQTGGKEAQAFMHSIVDGKLVSCTIPLAAESHDRFVGSCTVDGQDIGDVMTRAGLARDCWAFSHGRYFATQAPAALGLFLPSYCKDEKRHG